MKNSQLNSRALGYYGEKLCVDYLISKGYTMFQQNYTIKGGEIDIVAKEKNTFVFIEVKTRISKTFGQGEDAFNFFKKQRIGKAVKKYLHAHSLFGANYRIDLVQIELDAQKCLRSIEHFEDVEM